MVPPEFSGSWLDVYIHRVSSWSSVHLRTGEEGGGGAGLWIEAEFNVTGPSSAARSSVARWTRIWCLWSLVPRSAEPKAAGLPGTWCTCVNSIVRFKQRAAGVGGNVAWGGGASTAFSFFRQLHPDLASDQDGTSDLLPRETDIREGRTWV